VLIKHGARGDGMGFTVQLPGQQLGRGQCHEFLIYTDAIQRHSKKKTRKSKLSQSRYRKI